MKLAVFLLACVAFVAVQSAYVPTSQAAKYADKTYLEQQKFLFEILYRVEDPLMFEEYIKYGGKFLVDQSLYSSYQSYMTEFYEKYLLGEILPKGEEFSVYSKDQMKQALGLFQYFYYAKSWETFVQNVCWARIHVNEGLFVHALTLAVIHRPDCQGLILPSIYEIFPQNFFNSKYIYQAEKFDYSVWSKYAMYEKEYKDIYYQNVKDINGNYVYMKDFKTWQWWKLMGLGEQFYPENKCMIRENYNEYSNDPNYVAMLKNLKMFWAPVDYTRDIYVYNDLSKLSYFTEDLGWNAYWYYLNMDYSVLLDGQTYGLNKDRRGAYWIHNVQQILARYYMERLSHGFGDIEEYNYQKYYQYGYDSQLVSYNGVGYTYRKNYYDIYSYGNSGLLNKIQNLEQRLLNVIDSGIYEMYNGTKIDLKKPEAIEYIGNILQGNIDNLDYKFFGSWLYLTHFYTAGVEDIYSAEFMPNVFLNYETILRDPLFYSIYKKVADIYYRFQYQFTPYSQDDLIYEGVKIDDVHVGKLITYFDLVDFDATNLLNDKMTFVDGKFVWDKTLLARQMRLNHKPFNYDITVTSDKNNKVAVRAFLGPKYDEFGRTISLAENRENFVEIDEFYYNLVAGQNVIKRSSNEFAWTVKDRTTYTELYYYVMNAYEGKYQFPLNISQPHCGFPDRLILPRGWYNGMPMQMFFIVSPYTANYEQYSSYDPSYSCGIGSGQRHIDNLPFGYPFDRTINEYDFYVPNMYFKDVKIYHEDKFEKYYYQHYENFGQFDYGY